MHVTGAVVLPYPGAQVTGAPVCTSQVTAPRPPGEPGALQAVQEPAMAKLYVFPVQGWHEISLGVLYVPAAQGCGFGGFPAAQE